MEQLARNMHINSRDISPWDMDSYEPESGEEHESTEAARIFNSRAEAADGAQPHDYSYRSRLQSGQWMAAAAAPQIQMQIRQNNASECNQNTIERRRRVQYQNTSPSVAKAEDYYEIERYQQPLSPQTIDKNALKMYAFQFSQVNKKDLLFFEQRNQLRARKRRLLPFEAVHHRKSQMKVNRSHKKLLIVNEKNAAPLSSFLEYKELNAARKASAAVIVLSGRNSQDQQMILPVKQSQLHCVDKYQEKMTRIERKRYVMSQLRAYHEDRRQGNQLTQESELHSNCPSPRSPRANQNAQQQQQQNQQGTASNNNNNSNWPLSTAEKTRRLHRSPLHGPVKRVEEQTQEPCLYQAERCFVINTVRKARLTNQNGQYHSKHLHEDSDSSENCIHHQLEQSAPPLYTQESLNDGGGIGIETYNATRQLQNKHREHVQRDIEKLKLKFSQVLNVRRMLRSCDPQEGNCANNTQNLPSLYSTRYPLATEVQNTLKGTKLSLKNTSNLLNSELQHQRDTSSKRCEDSPPKVHLVMQSYSRIMQETDERENALTVEKNYEQELGQQCVQIQGQTLLKARSGSNNYASPAGTNHRRHETSPQLPQIHQKVRHKVGKISHRNLDLNKKVAVNPQEIVESIICAAIPRMPARAQVSQEPSADSSKQAKSTAVSPTTVSSQNHLKTSIPQQKQSGGNQQLKRMRKRNSSLSYYGSKRVDLENVKFESIVQAADLQNLLSYHIKIGQQEKKINDVKHTPIFNQKNRI